MKKIVYSLEQNFKNIETEGNSSYAMFMYMKNIMNLIREKQNCLEKQELLKDISILG